MEIPRVGLRPATSILNALAHPQVARELRGHALFGAVFNGSPAEMGIDFRAASEVASDGRPLVLLFKPKEKLSCKLEMFETVGR